MSLTAISSAAWADPPEDDRDPVSGRSAPMTISDSDAQNIGNYFSNCFKAIILTDTRHQQEELLRLQSLHLLIRGRGRLLRSPLVYLSASLHEH